MKRIWLSVLLAAALLMPGLAFAAPAPISLASYRALLQEAENHLEAARRAASGDLRRVEAARRLLDSEWTVQTPRGEVGADLRPVAAMLEGPAPRERVEAALLVVQEHLRAADASQSAGLREFPDARRRLEESLEDARLQKSFWNRVAAWFGRQLRRFEGGTATGEVTGGVLKWVALLVGLVGVSLISYNLWRVLSGQTGGKEARLRADRGGRPDRPATPDELWQMARELAGQGDYREGLRLTHLAVLQHFDRLALLRYDPAATNREHERLLRRRHPDLARAMHSLNDLVENRLYSGNGASADDFARGGSLAEQLWREGDAASKSAQAHTGASSSAPLR